MSRDGPIHRWIKRRLGLLVVVALSILCGAYIHSRLDEFAFVRSLSGPSLALGAVMLLAAYLVSVRQFGLFLAHFHVRPGLLRLTALTMGMCLGNLVTPMRGGTAAAALYLRSVYGLDYASFAVIYGGTGLLTILINSGLALLATLLPAVSGGSFHPALAALSALLFVGCLGLCLWPPRLMHANGRWAKKAAEAARGWRELARQRPLLLKISLTFLLVSILLAGSFYFIYQALEANVSLLGALMISSLGNIVNLAAITPGALGIYDAAVIQLPRELGLDAPRAVTAALIFRAFSFFWPALLGLPGVMYMGVRRESKVP